MNSTLIQIILELVQKAYNCIFIQDNKIHNVEGLLSSCATYIKSAQVVARHLQKPLNEKEKEKLKEIMKMLIELTTVKYENTKFKNVMDKVSFEKKYKKVVHHANVLANAIRLLLK